MSHQVSSLFHVETWKTLNLSDFKFSDGFKSHGKNVFKASVLIFCRADLIPLLEKEVCDLSAFSVLSSLFVFVSIFLKVQRNLDDPRLAAATKDSCISFYRFVLFQL